MDLRKRAFLVTGGTGSFGKTLVRRLLRDFSPTRLVVLSRDEQKHHQMSLELNQEDHPTLRFFIGDVRDGERLRQAFEGIEIVVHAAAMKHVPLAEYNPFEAIKTNIGGAENVIKAAHGAGVKAVIALSTDKAASPINLYGATKLCSDKCFVAANQMFGGTTRFSVVRYGNVIGSKGSVVELFKAMIGAGVESLPITDERMTRFWITLEEAADFVLARLSDMRGGEIFVPKIPSMSMREVAHFIAPAVSTHITGIRPGEKLHETLIPADESRKTEDAGKHYVIRPDWDLPKAPMPDGFSYRSDTSPLKMTGEALSRALGVQ